MFFDRLRRFVRINNEGNETNGKDLGIEEVIVSVGEKTDSLMKIKTSKTSIGNFYIIYQVLLSEEVKKDIHESDIEAFNAIIEDLENIKREMEKESKLYILEGYKEDILYIMDMKKELLESNSYIEKGLNDLIDVINQRIKFINPK